MKWTVLFAGNADDELMEIWLNADNRQSITDAAYRIEQVLRRDPDKKGEDFYGDRIYQDGPLAVVYELRPDDCLVRVVQFLRIKG